MPLEKPHPDLPPDGFTALFRDGRVFFHWEETTRGARRYRIFCGPESGQYDRFFTAGNRSFVAEPELDGLAFEQGKTYYAVIQAIHGDGRLSEKSREIRFKASENRRSEKTQIPIDSQAKVLWHNVNQWVQMVMF